MQRKIVFLRQEFTTRRYAFIWISIWLILIFSTWFSRPLTPFQETLFSGIVWELYQSGNWLYPQINGIYQHASYPLNYWLGLVIWELFGVSEFSLRALASFFSLGTLFLTAWAAYQLWPDRRDVRANAPFVLIGSLMWTIFATANLDYLYFTFYLMLAMNFLIRSWRFKQNAWWIGYGISLTLGLYSAGLIFLLVAIPIIYLAPYWVKDRWKQVYLWGSISVIIALIFFLIWAIIASSTLGFSLIDALGLNYILKALNNTTPFYLYFFNLIIILFPWLFWLRIYRLYREVEWDDSLRFVVIWFLCLIVILGILSLTFLDALLPLYPALGLIIARIYRNGLSRKRDIALIILIMVGAGLLLILIPRYYQLFNLPQWVGEVSPFWGAGLILFSITLLFNAAHTRIMTLALMSVALTLALNFGVVRVALDFYDLKPVGERISWYQSKGFTVANASTYRGHLQFEGRLTSPIVEVFNKADVERLMADDPQARIILYLEQRDLLDDDIVEYWQPFRGRYLMVARADHIYRVLQDLEAQGATKEAREALGILLY